MRNTTLIAFMVILLSTALGTANANSITLISGNAAIGQSDPDITVSGVAFICLVNGVPYPAAPVALQQAIVINPAHPLWVSPIAGTNWVSLETDGIGPTNGYDYETTFTLPGGYVNPSITVSYYCDDAGQWLMLNGNVWGTNYNPSNQTGQMGTFATNDPSFFKPGVNTLDFVVYNQMAWTGLDYYATVSYTPVPEPSVNQHAIMTHLGA